MVALTPLLLSGCAQSDEPSGSGDPGDRPLLVMAATSLATVMPQLIDGFTGETGTLVDLATGSTGGLAAQIGSGAPADLFFAADEETVERLVASGAIRASSVRHYATGRLALVWRAGLEPPGGPEALIEGRYDVIAIANPEIAPYGAAARETLAKLEIWDTISARIIHGENVGQAYQFVRTGNADAAFVARTIVDTIRSPFLDVDPLLYRPLRHTAGILERSRHPAAEAFLDFVLSDQGQALLAEHGFARAAD